MNAFRKLILGVVALAGFAIATPAQAHDHHHWREYHHRHYWGGPVVTYYSTPSYYSYDPYYYDYYRPYPYYYRPHHYYSYGPTVSFGFGGHGYRYHHW